MNFKIINYKLCKFLTFFTALFYSIFLILGSIDSFFIKLAPTIFFILHLFFLAKISASFSLNKIKTLFLVFFSGSTAFSVQLVWVPILSIVHFKEFFITPVLYFFVYSFFLGIYHLAFFSTSLIFKKKSVLKKFLLLLLLSPGYFIFLHTASGFIFIQRCGYPFFYPFLPLSSYFSQSFKIKNLDIFYINPNLKKDLKNEIYNQLFDIFEKEKKENFKLILSPESCFPFEIEKEKLFKQLIFSELEKNSCFFLGTRAFLDDENKKTTQAIALFEKNKKVRIFKKEKLVPLFEDRVFFPELENKSKIFELNLKNNSYKFLVLICYEFFSSPFFLLKKEKHDFILLFIKESWFCAFLQNLINQYVDFFAALSGKKIILISHSGLRTSCFSGIF